MSGSHSAHYSGGSGPNRRGDDYGSSTHGHTGHTSHASHASHTGTPNFRWWIPADGIRRDVIQADIQRYLGPEAVVRPGEGRDNDRGRQGYWIAAYRTLTPAMVQDLKADSANFERSGDRGAYENSMVHRSRQHWGPSSEQSTPVSSRADSESTYASGGSRPTAPSTYSNQSYEAPNNPGYGYQSGYSRTEREPDPRYQAPRDPRESHAGYQSGQPTYTGGSVSIAQPETNYTHHPLAHTHQGQAGSQPYGATADYGGRAPSDPFARPRQYVENPGAAAGGYGPSTGQMTSNVPHTARNAPPGYYLASDGRYYPESSRPT